jgi:hypothetical protein
LIAAEPLVASPVDLAYDEDGRAYVVEMRDYPYPEEKNAAPTVFPGNVRLLEDLDGDGKFDKATSLLINSRPLRSAATRAASSSRLPRTSGTSRTLAATEGPTFAARFSPASGATTSRRS